MKIRFHLTAPLLAAAMAFSPAFAQHTPPPDDIRSPEIRRDALVGVTVVPRPGERIEGATVLLRDGLVEAIGADLDVPAGYRVRILDDHFVYPGFIDPAVVRGAGSVLDQAKSAAGSHWNDRIVPQVDMRNTTTIDAGGRKALREQGFTIAQVLPQNGILRGSGAVVMLADRDVDARPLTEDGMLFAAFETGGWGGSYPGSKMGAIALLRQTFAEADWHARNRAMYLDDADGMEPPEQSDALDALQGAIGGDQIVVFDADSELDALRAARIIDEYELNGAVLGSGMEFRRAREIAETGLPVITPLKFPEAPAVKDPYTADRVTLRDLQTWKHATSNPRRLLEAGIPVAFTTHRLDSPGSFHASVRKTIEAGLGADEALACITTRPARLLGIEDVAGTIRSGGLANLVVMDGEIFKDGSNIREVWVAGRRSEVKVPPRFPIGGEFDVLVDGETIEGLEASIDQDKNRLAIAPKKTESETEDDADGDAEPEAEGDDGEADPTEDDAKPVREDPVSGSWDCEIEVPNMGGLPVTLTLVLDENDLVTGGMSSDMFSAELGGRFDRAASTLEIRMSMEGGPGAELQLKLSGDRLEGSSEMPGGRTANLTGSKVAGMEADEDSDGKPERNRKPGGLRNIKVGNRGVGFAGDGGMFGLEGDVVGTAVIVEDRLVGSLQTLDGRFVPFELVPRMSEETTEEMEPGDGRPEDDEADEATEEDVNEIEPLEALPVPLGVYGRIEPLRQRNVLIQDATIWTAGDEGVIEAGDLLVVDGRIVGVGVDLEAPAGVTVVDGTGLHLTPGLIDCHSHTGISGGVNEGGQTNTAEVRIGDVIDPDDIDFFRQLAGGLTAVNQLHGSANPIGGQNSVVKLRWGGTVEDMKFEGAKPGIKFALGENVKRGSGYPDTRMGVAAFIEDAFQAALEYDAARDAFAALPPEEQARRSPPRPDFELDAVVEILDGERIIHCHSYRQDEILMLLRLCERYGVRIGTLQHILEGYKVADEIAAHGAGASSFSDWWAYKMEVMDAIPHNGALMNEVGVLVSFNSDDDELATRMNDEAAKAVRWGGLDPHEALKFVTINPARQLRIDDRVGSLEPGKDADFVIWNAAPLSSFARCEETWIDGIRYYDREEAAEMHAEAMLERGKLLAKASGGATGDEPEAGERPGRRGRPTGLLARMLQDRENLLLERVARGEDPAAIKAGECGCGSASMIELARSLARDRARLETLESEESR